MQGGAGHAGAGLVRLSVCVLGFGASLVLGSYNAGPVGLLGQVWPDVGGKWVWFGLKRKRP